MPTMAQWGSKKWAVSSKQVVALEGLAFSYEQVADENTSTEDKKTTNERYFDPLNPESVDFRFHL